MLTRLWRTEFDPGRLDELQRFADEVSAPMFRALPGCLGFVYAVSGTTWVTQTFWESREQLAAAEATERYRETVRRIVDEGFLGERQETEVFEVTSYAPPAPETAPAVASTPAGEDG